MSNQLRVQQLSLFDPVAGEPQTASKTLLPSSDAVTDQVSDYLSHLARVGKARHTLDATRRDLDQLAAYLGSRNVAEIGTADLLAFVEALGSERSNGRASQRRKIATAKAFCRYLLRRGRLATDPSAALPYPPPADREAEPLSEPEIERVLGEPLAREHRALFLLMLDAGLKREEVLSLRVPDVQLRPANHGFLVVCRRLAAQRVRTRTVNLTERLAEALQEQIANRPADAALIALSTRGVDYIVREVGSRASLDQRVALTPQRLRDTFAVRWLRARSPREDAQLDAAARRDVEADHDHQLAEILGLAPNSLALARYRRAARREHDGPEAAVLLNV